MQFEINIFVDYTQGGSTHVRRRRYSKHLPFGADLWTSLFFAVVLGNVILKQGSAQSETHWLSGQDSPVHDSDSFVPVSGKISVLENEGVRVAVDSVSGALLELVNKKTGWKIQQTPQLAESFRVFAPTPERSYNPILGSSNTLASIARSSDGTSLVLTWSSLLSEYRSRLDITLIGTISLHGDDVTFDMQVRNKSQWTISSVDWPVIGSLGKPRRASTMMRMVFDYGTGHEVSLFPTFQNERGYFGTNFPIQMGTPLGFGRYNIVQSGNEGLYLGIHDISFREAPEIAFELKPGYSDSLNQRCPLGNSISGHPVRIVTSIVHFPFVPSGQSVDLARIVLSPFVGDWHRGADVYRRWRATWFRAPPSPRWVRDINSWQQIQINSAEDDLRTSYRDLPRRAEAASRAGITAIQLVGWNNGGQDRGNPSHDIDPRLGTYQDLKDAIEKIEEMGVHVILFNKYTWVDTSSPTYDKGLQDHVAHDPNGLPYVYHGYMYQTPEQLADMNTRRLAVACTADPSWIDLSAKEFRKSIDLGASGILYDEVVHHGGANYCFHVTNGQLTADSLWAGDSMIGERFRETVDSTVGSDHFLMAGEDPYDLEARYYSLSYFRIFPGHIPLERYDDPSQEMMIAVTGFDDREMINEALRFRYIMSYEPFNFKGNLSDFPLTLNYGTKVDAFRRRYRAYVWDAEFRDNQDARVTVSGQPFTEFSTFRRPDGRQAVVVINQARKPIIASVHMMRGTHTLKWASPEHPDLHQYTGSVSVPPRSAVVVMEN